MCRNNGGIVVCWKKRDFQGLRMSYIGGVKADSKPTVLFVLDSLASLKPASDTSLMLMSRIPLDSVDVYLSEPEEIELAGASVSVIARRVIAAPDSAIPKVGEREQHQLARFSAIAIRKDPPFNESYVSLCWLLNLELSRVKRWLNSPETLLRYHEKLIPFEAIAQGFLSTEDVIPTYLGSLHSAERWMREGERFIAKPFLGHGGREISSLSTVSQLAAIWRDGETLLQPEQEAVHTLGDIRVFFFQGKRRGHFTRKPKAGSVASNLAQGGKAERCTLTESQVEVLEKLGKFLTKAGITFAGVDLIGTRISEVNITSPTGLPTLLKLEGIDLAQEIAEWLACQA